jgi:uncharacterized protein YdcH (DUF465 family)
MDQLRSEFRAEFRAEIRALRDETMSHFDAVFKRFDRLETEYVSLSAAVRRLEGN